MVLTAAACASFSWRRLTPPLRWVKHTVRAIVDRELTIFEGRSQNPVDAYRLVVRHWTIKRGWIYEVWSEIEFSYWVESGHVVVSDEKPTTDPDGARIARADAQG